MPVDSAATGDELHQASVGTLDGANAFTIACIVKKDGSSHDASGGGYLLTMADVGFAAYTVFFVYDTGNWLALINNTGSSAATALTLAAADGWCLIAVTRPAGGAQTVRMHKYVFSTGTWSHSNDGTLSDDAITSCEVSLLSAGGGGTFNGHMEAAGVWKRVLTDGEIEALAHDWMEWVASNPDWYVLLDQDSTGQSVPNLGTNRGTMSRTGTVVSSEKTPIATLGGPILVNPSAGGAGATTLTPSAAATPLVAPAPTVARTKTITPSAASTPLVAPSATMARTKTQTPSPASTQLVAPSVTLVMGTAVKTPSPASTPLVAPAPTIVRTKTLTPTPASTQLVAPAPTLSFVTTRTPTPASTTLVAPSVTVVLGTKTLTPSPASTPLVAAGATMVRTRTQTPTPAATPLVAPAPTVTRTKTVSPSPASTPLVAPSVSVSIAGAKTPDPAVVILVAPSPTIVRTKTLTPSPASTPLVAASPSLVRTKTVTPSPASTPLVAAAATMLTTTQLTPSPASTPLVAPTATVTGTGAVTTYRKPDLYWYPAIRELILRRRARSPRP